MNAFQKSSPRVNPRFKSTRRTALLFLCAAALTALALACSSSAPARPETGLEPSEPAPGSLAAARAAVDLRSYRKGLPEARAKSVPADIAVLAFTRPSAGLPKLVAWLLEGQSDPYLRAKILHDWEAVNIHYDVKAYYSGRIADQSPYSVLARRRAVCAGYAGLYKTLCDLGGVECAVVSGEARGINFSEGKGLMGHDWNAVRIDGVWRLIDVTWDSGYVNSPTDFADHYQTAYFLLDPEFMIYTHFPASSRMQFLDRPLSHSEFDELPYADGEFLSITRRDLAGLSIMNKSKGLSAIDIPHAPGVRLGASLRKGGSKSWNGEGKSGELSIPIVEGEGQSTLTLAFPSSGDYILSVYAWIDAAAEDGSGGADAGKTISAGSCLFRFHSSGAYKPSGAAASSLVGFDPAFQQLAGLPREGGVLDSRVGKEFSLNFPCGPETRMKAYLLSGDLSVGASSVPGAVAVSRVPGGCRIDVAFPAKGDYHLSLSAQAPGKKEVWSMLNLSATEAADHGYLEFQEAFLDLAGEPLGGAAISDRAGPEFSLSFPASSDASIEASLCTLRKSGSNQPSYWVLPDSKRLCIARRGPEGTVVRVAFPGPGDYCLWLEAKGPKGEKASSSLNLKASGAAGHGYFNLDPALVELAGEPSLAGPDGAAAGAPSSDLVGRSLGLLFPKGDAALSAALYTPRKDGDSTRYDWLGSLSSKRGPEGLLFTVAFPKPGDYVIFFTQEGADGAKSRSFEGLYLSSR
jgi:hypothetical protein